MLNRFYRFRAFCKPGICDFQMVYEIYQKSEMTQILIPYSPDKHFFLHAKSAELNEYFLYIHDVYKRDKSQI